MTTADAHAKVLFRLPQDEDGYPPMDTEGVWASKNDDGSLTIDNIPFFTKEATLGDRVCAIARDDQLFYHSTIEHSGNSLLRVVFFEQSELPHLRSQLSSRGCPSELSHIDSLISVNVPSHVSLNEITLLLDQGRDQGLWDYEEAIIHQTP
jgi:hypothetical protein